MKFLNSLFKVTMPEGRGEAGGPELPLGEDSPRPAPSEVVHRVAVPAQRKDECRQGVEGDSPHHSTIAWFRLGCSPTLWLFKYSFDDFVCFRWRKKRFIEGIKLHIIYPRGKNSPPSKYALKHFYLYLYFLRCLNRPSRP